MVRMVLLAGASLAALVGTAADAASFAYTGSVQNYLVTQTGIYTLTAFGAQGGRSNGGLGAYVSGRLSLTSGTTLSIVVGGRGVGTGDGYSGGGGSFIYSDLATPLAVAGGGGGGGYQGHAGGSGVEGVNGGPGGLNGGPGGSAGGTAGSGGQGQVGRAGGGGGWLSNGNLGSAGGRGGPSGFTGGVATSRNGGFGGGGSGGTFDGGGGGGFSGGGGGYYGGGGGGGSFIAASATDIVLQSGVNSGDGSASIDLFSAAGGVPEPSSWAMLITGFGGIGAMLRRRRLRTA